MVRIRSAKRKFPATQQPLTSYIHLGEQSQKPTNPIIYKFYQGDKVQSGPRPQTDQLTEDNFLKDCQPPK